MAPLLSICPAEVIAQLSSLSMAEGDGAFSVDGNNRPVKSFRKVGGDERQPSLAGADNHLGRWG